MCVLCGRMFGEIHWSERQLDPVQVSHGSGETSSRQERHARIRLLRKVLAQYGLEVGDDWSVTNFIVGNRKGDQRLVAAMGELWRRPSRWPASRSTRWTNACLSGCAMERAKHDAARAIIAAVRVVITKSDLTTRQDVVRCRVAIRALNPTARIIMSRFGEAFEALAPDEGQQDKRRWETVLRDPTGLPQPHPCAVDFSGVRQSARLDGLQGLAEHVGAGTWAERSAHKGASEHRRCRPGGHERGATRGTSARALARLAVGRSSFQSRLHHLRDRPRTHRLFVGDLPACGRPDRSVRGAPWLMRIDLLIRPTPGQFVQFSDVGVACAVT